MNADEAKTLAGVRRDLLEFYAETDRNDQANVVDALLSISSAIRDLADAVRKSA